MKNSEELQEIMGTPEYVSKYSQEWDACLIVGPIICYVEILPSEIPSFVLY